MRAPAPTRGCLIWLGALCLCLGLLAAVAPPTRAGIISTGRDIGRQHLREEPTEGDPDNPNPRPPDGGFAPVSPDSLAIRAGVPKAHTERSRCHSIAAILSFETSTFRWTIWRLVLAMR